MIKIMKHKKEIIMKFDIWVENICSNEHEGVPQKAFCIAQSVIADSFKEACDKFLAISGYGEYYDPSNKPNDDGSIFDGYAYKLYDNEKDANWMSGR